MSPTKFVRTPEEIARIKEILGAGRFTTDGIEVEFETTPEFVREVLPPCLSPAEAPTGIINVSKWEGEMCGEFGGAIIWIRARHEAVEGLYCLLMLISGDMPVTLGREVWGECKKVGSMDLFRDGPYMFGYGERNGTRLIEVEAEFGPDLGPLKVTDTLYELKAQFNATGDGLQYDPILVELRADGAYTNVREGTATVKLTGSRFDPVDEIPIVSVGTATHVIGESCYRAVRQFPQPDHDTLMPYILGRSYDDLALFRVPQRHRVTAPT